MCFLPTERTIFKIRDFSIKHNLHFKKKNILLLSIHTPFKMEFSFTKMLYTDAWFFYENFLWKYISHKLFENPKNNMALV